MKKEHVNPAIREFIKERGIKDLQGVHAAVKELTADLLQGILEGELENELGYSKWDYRNKITPNSRNGYSGKTVQSSQGEIDIKVPRDRDGDFDPELIKKYDTDISSIEDKILTLYSQGMSTRDIEKTEKKDDEEVLKILCKVIELSLCFQVILFALS